MPEKGKDLPICIKTFKKFFIVINYDRKGQRYIYLLTLGNRPSITVGLKSFYIKDDKDKYVSICGNGEIIIKTLSFVFWIL